MGLDGVHRQEHPGRDLLRGEELVEVHQDLGLALGERLDEDFRLRAPRGRGTVRADRRFLTRRWDGQRWGRRTDRLGMRMVPALIDEGSHPYRCLLERATHALDRREAQRLVDRHRGRVTP